MVIESGMQRGIPQHVVRKEAGLSQGNDATKNAVHLDLNSGGFSFFRQPRGANL